MTNIGPYAFSGCGGLLSITVGEGNANYTSRDGFLLSKDGQTLLQGVNGDVTVPSGVTSIGYEAFRDCSGLTSVTMPDGVMNIGSLAFYGCNGLRSVSIGNGVTNIGNQTFQNCSGLTSVTIPNSVTSIGSYAFSYCRGLTNVTFMGNAPMVGYYSAFYSVDSSCIASVSPKSIGWGVGVGEKWNGLTLQYWPELLTAVEGDSEVGEIIATFEDKELAAQVSTAAEYDAFRSWVNDNNLYQPAVVANTNAAAAYLLGAERLFENAPKVEIEDIVVGDEGTEGTKGMMTVAVSVKDGEEVVPCDAEKVAAMFESTSDLGDWNGEAKLTPTVEQLGTVDGAMRFKVTPGDGNSSKAFLRIKR